MLQTLPEFDQSQLRTVLETLGPYGPEIAALVIMALSALAAKRADKPKRVRDLVHRIESKLHRLLDEMGLFEPTREQVDIQFVNEAIKPTHETWERTHSDGTYYATTRRDVERIADRFTWIKAVPYRHDTFDCENFARLFKALVALRYGVSAVGIVTDYKAAHAYLVFILTDGETVYVEPQEAAIVEQGERREVGGQRIRYLGEGGDGRLTF